MGKLALLGMLPISVFLIIVWRIDPSQLWIVGVFVLVLIGIVSASILMFSLKHPDLATLEGGEVILMKHQAQFGTDKRIVAPDAVDALEKTANPLSKSE